MYKLLYSYMHMYIPICIFIFLYAYLYSYMHIYIPICIIKEKMYNKRKDV